MSSYESVIRALRLIEWISVGHEMLVHAAVFYPRSSFIMQHQVLRGFTLFLMRMCGGGCSGLSLAVCTFQGYFKGNNHGN